MTGSTCSKCRRLRPPLRRGLCPNCYESARQRIGFESKYVDAEPARQHVNALVEAGVSRRHICRIAGLHRGDLATLMNGRGKRGLAPSRQIFRDKADRILAIPLPAAALHRLVSPGQFVPAVGTLRRLRALVAIGYTQADLSRRIGILPTNGSRLFSGKHTVVTAATALRVETLFNETQLIPGPSERARRRAADLGWPPPLAWDEDTIDDPAATADRTTCKRSRKPELYVELRELGYSDAQIVQKLDTTAVALERALYRDNIPVRPGLVELAREERNARVVDERMTA
ncbi:helix-turn-helix domain-containing protein [Mycobacterium aquaticum]|uniref:Uncharacterized protein n=1 Tax=Mycobacterium aquaticum TaxID=1927124 RepID=A0A1X0A032_9MYCO|nr:helix-turn-helix transcriptional regulator [Mycobacterium aquaticum]ORA23419.1 hypothetical protein BST13_35295 [Mycobacterium aquaticum]